MAPEPSITPKTVQDDTKATAAMEIAMPEPDTVDFDGETYLVNYALVNDIEVMEAFQRGNAFFPAELNGALTALQKALGPDYERFKRDQQRKHGSCSATAIFELFGMVNRGAGGN